MSTTKVVKLSSLQANLAKERDGDWIPANDLGPGVAFFVRSTNSPEFQLARDLANMNLAKKYNGEPPSTPEEHETRSKEHARINGMLAVEHLLSDWRGLDTPFSEDVAATTLTDESYRRVRNSVYAAATKVGQRDVEFVESAAKNSGEPSVTN